MSAVWGRCPECQRPVVQHNGNAIAHSVRKSRGYVHCPGSGKPVEPTTSPKENS